MAYQNVGTPRFYVDTITWLSSSGISPGVNTALGGSGIGGDPAGATNFNGIQQWGTGTNLFSYINPAKTNTISFNYDFAISGSASLIIRNNSQPVDFIFILGTNYSVGGFGDNPLYIKYQDSAAITNIAFVSGVNYGAGTPFSSDYQGWGLVEFAEISPLAMHLYLGLDDPPPDLILNSIVCGKSYTMPNAPNLSLTMSKEYGGTKEFTTHNGGSMSNTMWNKPPKWGNYGAWELEGYYPALSRSGRRSWQLKFSYMDDGDLWGSNQMLSYISPNTDTQNYYSLGYELDDIFVEETDELDGSSTNFTYNLLTDNSFFSQVWHKTLGGTLPFIFQPDSSNNNPDQFAICKFKDGSLKATQSAPHVYDISLSIEEVW